jgi:GNAT superfamily N-acetyltransferase
MSMFVILALPRSRTTWLSRFLTYGDWTCNHEEIRHFRGLDDIKSWFSQDMIGSAETAGAPWWRLLLKYRPDCKVAVIRRDPVEVADSLMAIGGFNRQALITQMKKLDAKLDQIEHRIPNVLSVGYHNMNEANCARIFEHCLPYAHDHGWWEIVDKINIQCSMPALLRYYRAYQPQLQKLESQAKHTILAQFAAKPVVLSGGLSIQQESLASFYQDGQKLFADHLVHVGEAPEAVFNKNYELGQRLENNGALQIMVARCNGRMFGYLMTILSPSPEIQGLENTVACHTTFYASPEFPGLGLKLQRAALQVLRERGIKEVFWRAGVRGSGPRMGPLYRRLGAVEDGTMYRLEVA